MEKHLKKKINNELLQILIEVDRICKEKQLNYILIGGTLLGAVRHNGFIPWDDDIDIAMPREDFSRFIQYANNNLRTNFYLDYYTTNKRYWLPFAKVRLKNTVYQECAVKADIENNGFWIDIFPLDYTQNNSQSHLAKKKNRIKTFIWPIIFNKNSKTIKTVKGWKKIAYIFTYLIPNKLLINSREQIMQSENRLNHDYFINYGSQYDVTRQTHKISEVLPTKPIMFEGKEFMGPNNPDYVLKNIYGPNYMQLPPKDKQITHNPAYIKFEDGEEIYFNKKGI